MPELNLTPFPELITPRLFLRELRTEDAEEIFLLRSDEKVVRLAQIAGLLAGPSQKLITG
ncbi:MAG: hypothetical protein JWP78_179 [Mucilaginibacter sp.]|nr:hypothetical protein [Mucilaginibacter sp.]